jgi:alcohol dehydrogenase class IV
MRIKQMEQQVVHSRAGALAEVGEILERLSVARVFFVVDEPAYAASGAAAILDPHFDARSVTEFSGFELNPKLHDVEHGISQFREARPDVVVALGGGTAIDLAKLIGTLAEQNDSAREIIQGRARIERAGPPLIAIPTTAGTGSEATHFAVAYVDGEKYSVACETMLPDYAIVDPSLTHSLPSAITAATGLDAFCQAIESMWSVHSTTQSLGYADEAIQLAWRHLAAAVRHPDTADRDAMCRAAHLAGQAINISKTTAPHAISYTITSQLGVPHGCAVALSLGAVLAFNSQVTEADCNDSRGADYVRTTINHIAGLLGFDSPYDAEPGIRRFVASLNCPTQLTEVGVTTNAQIEELVQCVNVERLANNPRRLTSESLRAILRSIR